MYELAWENVDFNEGFKLDSNNFFESNNGNGIVAKVSVAIGTALLILGGLLIIVWAGISLYQTYTSDSQVKQAIQMAKDQNRQLDLNTSNSYTFTINVSSKSSLSLAGESATVTRVRVYPKNHRTEQIILPNGNILTPYLV